MLEEAQRVSTHHSHEFVPLINFMELEARETQNIEIQMDVANVLFYSGTKRRSRPRFLSYVHIYLGLNEGGIYNGYPGAPVGSVERTTPDPRYLCTYVRT